MKKDESLIEDVFISFPENEISALKERVDKKLMFYTTRVSEECGKYKQGHIYNSQFGKLKVMLVEHFDDINQHPFYRELTQEQKDEIVRYIGEKGYDLVCLYKL